MTTMMISVAFALAVATSAEAMSPAPLHQPDAMITQVRRGLPGPVLGTQSKIYQWYCVFYARPVSPAEHVCIAWWDGGGIEHYGTLKGGGQEGEVTVTPTALEALPWPTPERPIKQKLIPQLVSFC